MSKNRRHIKKHESKKPSGRIAKRLSAIFFAILIIALALLVFNVGKGFWPSWMIDHRRLFISIGVVLLIFLALMSPVIIQTIVNPQPHTGPGKNPEWPDWWP